MSFYHCHCLDGFNEETCFCQSTEHLKKESILSIDALLLGMAKENSEMTRMFFNEMPSLCTNSNTLNQLSTFVI
jgi:hypothetical protein